MLISPRRPLGRTGFVATAIGAGDLADPTLGVDVCAATLRRAVDSGVNVVDTAPAYEGGLSERIVGRALVGARQNVFVIDKIDHLDRPVGEQLAGSIDRLGFAPDAFVFHSVSRQDAWRPLMAAGGPFDRLEDERRRGACRFIGVSTHHPDVARAAIDSGRCDLVLLPVGPFVDPRYIELLPRALRLGVGTVGFKAFGAGKLVALTGGYGQPLPAATTSLAAPRLTVEACLHATLTLDPDVELLGLSTPAEQDEAFAALARFVPLDTGALAATRRLAAAAIEETGPVWWNPAR
jgi:aryl-alcohol dehydrogenase-like predicted oxidoreductase